MADQEEDHIQKLSKCNESKISPMRSLSMSIAAHEEYESDFSFISRASSLPTRTPPKPRFIPMNSPLRTFNELQRFPTPTNQTEEITEVNVISEEIETNDQDFHKNLRKNEHFLESRSDGFCKNPDCIDSPASYKKFGRSSSSIARDNKVLQLHYLYNEARKSIKKLIMNILSCLPLMNPDAKVVRQWNKFFVISCLIVIFIDPLFFFLFSIEQENKCMVLNWTVGTIITVMRSIADMIYFVHMFLQFRLAYAIPDKRLLGAGDLEKVSMEIALRYFLGYFVFDFFMSLPLPQVITLLVIPKHIGSSVADYLRASVLLQYIPRIVRFMPLIMGGQSVSGFLFESAWANFVMNLLMFVLAGHVVGSFWYLFGLQRLNQCLRDACAASKINMCQNLIDCGRGNNNNIVKFNQYRKEWIEYSNSSACLDYNSGQFGYGIYNQAVLLIAEHSFVTRYIYSFFWGFQQISTLAGNLVPGYFASEVLFTTVIVGLGLLLFALLIGNVQNFLQGLGRRKLEMQLRGYDVEQWMSHRLLPELLRREVRDSERFRWAVTRGVNEEEEFLSCLPEDTQRRIRHHYFGFHNFYKQVFLFSFFDDTMLNALIEKLRRKLYTRGNVLVSEGEPIGKVIFIVKGKLKCKPITENDPCSRRFILEDGDVWGAELITWYLEEHSYKVGGRGISRLQGLQHISKLNVRCLTNIEALILYPSDLDQVFHLYSHLIRNPRIQMAIRHVSPYWRAIAAIRIQVAWRERNRRLMSSAKKSKLISRTSLSII